MRRHFPNPRFGPSDGPLLATAQLSQELLLEAYALGIFPWSSDPVRWFCPDPRAIFLLDRTSPPKKIGKAIRKNGFKVTCDQAFEQVIRQCQSAHREDGEWISEHFIEHYTQLHVQGHAHSIEVWMDERLVGGLYGVLCAGYFAGESMFHSVSNASKVAFAALLHILSRIRVPLIDAQVINEHTHRLGAMLVSRDDFLMLLEMIKSYALPPHYWRNEWLQDFHT